jgi:dTDP-4-amino-4,6-dideoxygalactose transaminase
MLAERRRVFNLYSSAFKTLPWATTPPFEKVGCQSSFHLYPLFIKDITEQQRDIIIENIIEQGVSVNVHFIPMPMLSIFKNAGYDISHYPKSYALYSGEISLPVYPQLSNNDCAYVIGAVVNAVNMVLTNER